MPNPVPQVQQPNQMLMQILQQQQQLMVQLTQQISATQLAKSPTAKDDSDDLVSYSCKVNKACVDFKLRDLSEDQSKCLIFVCGLKSSRDSEIRMRLINKLNETEDISLEKLVEDCKTLLNLKQDNSLVEKQQSLSAVNAVHEERLPKPSNKQGGGGAVNNNQPRTPCWSCGCIHFSADCPFREHLCRECRKKGHREGYCAYFSSGNTSGNSKKKKKKYGGKNKDVRIVSVKNISQQRKFSEIEINKVPVRLQIDSASDITIISDECWRQIGQPQGTAPSCNAKSASGGSLELALEFWCDVNIGGKTKRGLCRVASPNLDLNILGSDWIELFGLWDVPINSFCNKVSSQQARTDESLQAQFPKVFSDEMGLCSKTKVRLTLKGDPKPVYRAKRPVAYSVQGAVEDELQRLQNLGILQLVDHSDWAAPIVVVRKPNGRVRICADFSTGLNDVLESNQCPLPLPEDIFTKMAGCKVFSHIDLSDAYLQVEVDPRDQPLLTVNTHRGLFRYTRLTPGIKSAPGAFQQIMDAVVSGIRRACGYLDDVLVGGRTKEEHDKNLKQVLKRLEEYGFTVRIGKCKFNMQEVEYLGQILDGDGIRPDPGKTSAIASMPPPQDVPSLRSYLGAVSNYAKYIPEMRKLRFPMDQLLKSGAKWIWSGACQRSFNRFREILQSPLALTHYNPSMKIIVSASADVKLRNWSAHCPQAARWISEADTICIKESYASRVKLQSNRERVVGVDLLNYVMASIELEDTVEYIVKQSVKALPVTFKMIQSGTKSDAVLKQVKQFVQTAWPSSQSKISDSQLQQFYQRRESLSIVADCLRRSTGDSSEIP
ncbi:uncharacterized protein K02A2.6-like [Wyeomyia smithii]|uniref:uncharacterized protein K02A2.6-like n=1 Tax=Wyeomyia smithii TaxID=174621 RepID=UPI0024680257|nr:uncharacterized protein K02A2.6-like [Wyeomyia smithii]